MFSGWNCVKWTLLLAMTNSSASPPSAEFIREAADSLNSLPAFLLSWNRCGVCEFCTTSKLFVSGNIAASCRSGSACCSAPNNTLSLLLAAKLKKQMIFSGVDGERAEWRVNIVLTFIKWPESALQMNANVAVWLLEVFVHTFASSAGIKYVSAGKSHRH